MSETENTLPILVVDDDPSIAQLLKMYLEKEGYSVTTCGRGDEGRETKGAGRGAE